MATFPQQQRISVADYLALDEQAQTRHEYIDGYLVLLAGGTLYHSTICLNIATLLRRELRGGSCRVYTSDVRTQLAETRFVYPDVTVSCHKGEGDATLLTRPCCVVEVLSPGTERYDRGKKFDYYRECPSIQEYMLVNVGYPQIEVYRREKQTLWSFQAFQAHQYVELVYLGVRFAVEEAYEDVEFSQENL